MDAKAKLLDLISSTNDYRAIKLLYEIAIRIIVREV